MSRKIYYLNDYLKNYVVLGNRRFMVEHYTPDKSRWGSIPTMEMFLNIHPNGWLISTLIGSKIIVLFQIVTFLFHIVFINFLEPLFSG